MSMLSKFSNTILQQTSIIFKILFESQHVFRETYPTGSALMELIEDIISNLDNNLVTIGVFY